MSEIKDTSKCGYYYHPLGELAKAFADGTADDSEWPHTYTKPGKYHGIGNLDWGSGKSIPPNSKVYSMTSGVITKIFKYTDDDGFGFHIYIKTDRLDGEGKTIEIHYIELAGFSERIANILGCKSGPMTETEVKMAPVNFSTEISVEMGEHIGYTNTWYSNFSNMHTDFVYVGRGDNNSDGNVDVSTYPHATESKLSNNFKLTDLSNGIKKVECDGKIVGRENGYVRTQYGGSSDTYKVWPHMSYMVCQQTPKYVSRSSSNVNNSILTPTERCSGYYTESFDSSLVSDSELLQLCQLAAHEIAGGNRDFTTEIQDLGVYAKLFRGVYLANRSGKTDRIITVLKNYGGFSNWGSRGYPTLTAYPDHREEVIDMIKTNLMKPEIYKMDGKFAQIASCYVSMNYGYSGTYSFNRNIEEELEKRILSKNLKSHIDNTESWHANVVLIGCIANTGYFTTTTLVKNLKSVCQQSERLIDKLQR